jgi:hypothetical protein
MHRCTTDDRHRPPALGALLAGSLAEVIDA